jgi:hypothetical protein
MPLVLHQFCEQAEGATSRFLLQVLAAAIGARHGSQRMSAAMSGIGGKARLRKRNEFGKHQYQVDDATYDLLMSHFVPPTPDEDFNVIVHKP